VPLLFAYWTLQQEAVQLSTFGRLLAGQPDEVSGFGYQGIAVELASGRRAWVYVDSRSRPPGG